MSASLDERLRADLDALEAAGLGRALSLLPGRIDFTSNDYLGLARHPELIAAARAALEAHGAGARASRLLGGGSTLDEKAEAAVAGWLGAEAALLFASGYQANLGAITSLASRGDVIFSDALNHASLIDAARLTRAERRVFRHGDLEHLELLLRGAAGARRRLVVTEGVFSMDGDLAPLAELHRLCEAYDAWLLVDEAHASGVVGPQGAGAWAAARASGCGESRLAARVVTGGKALGLAGGLVVGSATLRELVSQRARTFIYSTGISPALAGALIAAVGLARGAEEERAKLRGLGERLAGRLGVATPEAAIVPIVIGENTAAMEAAARLANEGLEVRAVRPPTVPEGTARLRCVLHSHNTPEEVDRLADSLESRRVTRVVAEVAPPHRAKPLFVVGTDTEIGKTVVSALLVRAAAKRGEVTYWKAVQTGDDSDTETVRTLAEGTNAAFAEPSYHFPLPASPHEAAADAGGRVELAKLEQRLASLRAECAGGALLVELAGGLLVPYDDRLTQADWLARERPDLVLVARSGLGTLNHTLLTLEALRARRLEPRALFLVGEPHPSNRETLALRSGLRHVFELPRLDELGPESLEQWLGANDLGSLFGH